MRRTSNDRNQKDTDRKSPPPGQQPADDASREKGTTPDPYLDAQTEKMPGPPRRKS